LTFTLSTDKNIIITLNAKQIAYCNKIAEVRKKMGIWEGEYGNGILNSLEDPWTTERLGMFGEYSWYLLTGLPIDERKLMKGDKWDFLLDGNKFDIKTKKEDTDDVYEGCKFYIRAVNNYGKVLTLTSDYYLFATLLSHNGNDVKKDGYGNFYRSHEKATEVVVCLNGFISREKILRINRIGPALSKKCSHKNYYIKEDETTKVIKLLNKYRQQIHPQGEILNF
tara:strand:+ start:2575 stop:3246 length:672 start_codon:yes stop_codon:yes gene_type:complete